MIAKNTYRLLILLAIVLLFSFDQQNTKSTELISLNSIEQYSAGNRIVLKFHQQNAVSLRPMLVSGSYGKVLVYPAVKKDTISYEIPPAIALKSGQVRWRIPEHRGSIQGAFTIVPADQMTTVESYLGPPNIVVGGDEFAMLVSLLMDRYDNPSNDGTSVQVNTTYLGQQIAARVDYKNTLAYHRIYSPLKTGRILASTAAGQLISNEFALDILPGLPMNYRISFRRVHEFADGNQICTFNTSKILDKFGNTIADGTAVNFVIKNDRNELLNAFGTTIDGRASAAIVHPEKSSFWTVNSFIDGLAKSNSVTLNFKPSVLGFDIAKNYDNQLVVGPIKSFMNQLIPDGFSVRLKTRRIKQKDTLEVAYTRKGYAYFDLSAYEQPKRDRSFEISVGDQTKIYHVQDE